MGTLSPSHLMILALVFLLVFGGRTKLSGIMGDAAKGIRAFRDGLKHDQPGPAGERPPAPTERRSDNSSVIPK
ncbi:MAG: twin-arginine translocation protein TatA/E family subunit [Phenylobacterium sp.]|jgi:sec-independent protein translocase protein TatA|nr:twin-arginine translocation protein TatA/E family subunit [Phenylobacterium sp.]